MSKNFGTRKAFKGHIISDKELSDLAKEYAASMFQALAMNHPVKLVTLDQTETGSDSQEIKLKETGASFFTVASPKVEPISKFTTTHDLRQYVTELCRSVVTTTLDLWPKEHAGSPIYLLTESKVALTPKDHKIEVEIALHLAGAKKESVEAPSQPLEGLPVGPLEIVEPLQVT
jgi:hypothetical protein